VEVHPDSVTVHRRLAWLHKSLGCILLVAAGLAGPSSSAAALGTTAAVLLPGLELAEPIVNV
jgi:hypothetical protein